MSDSGKAVFLSYASQDSEAARRICDALRDAGVEVWFDQSELRGGDAWDQKIRRQIKECALFVPLISANTNSRPEGYFRLEWKLAVDRSHLLADDHPFLFPIAIGDVTDATARVPDKFRDVQWTRLRLDETPAELAKRITRLLQGGTNLEAGRPRPAEQRGEGTPSPRNQRPAWLRYGWAAVGILFGLIYAVRPLFQSARPRDARPPAAVAPFTEARQLVAKAWEQMNKPGMARAELEVADGLCQRAAALDPNDADVWAAWSQVDSWYIYHNLDHTPERREGARTKAARAMNLAPGSYEARLAQACYLVRGVVQAGNAMNVSQFAAEADGLLRVLLQEKPGEPRALHALGILLRNTGNLGEAREVFGRLAKNPAFAATALNELGWAEWVNCNYRAAETAADASIALQPFWGNLMLKVSIAESWRGDLALAKATLDRIPAATQQEDQGVACAVYLYYWRREPENMLRVLNDTPRDWLQSNGIDGPKASLAALAQQMAGHGEAARVQWQKALKLVEQRLADQPDSGHLLRLKGRLLAAMGLRPEAETALRLAREIGEKNSLVADAAEQVLLGNLDAATTLLERAADEKARFVTAASYRLNPAWDPLRDQPRFEALLARMEADPRFSPNVLERTAPSVAIAPDPKSVVVLPFANLSGDPAQEYFSDGLTEEILNALARERDLRVVPRTSAFSFKGKNLPLPEIARTLNVAQVVEGSVQRAGNRVRILCTLTRVADGFPVALPALDRELKDAADIFALEDEVARAVVEKLTRHTATTSPVAVLTKDSAAYDAFLRGRDLMNRTSPSWPKAVESLRRAVELDPQFALAWANLGQLCASLYVYGFDGAALAASGRAIEEAIRLQPELFEAHLARAHYLRAANANPDAVEHELEVAERIRPDDPAILEFRASVAFSRGREESGINLMRRAVDLDPRNGANLNALGNELTTAGRYAEAEAIYRQAFQILDSSIPLTNRARVYFLWKGDGALAARTLDEAPEAIRGERYWTSRALLLYATGDQPGALAAAAHMKPRSEFFRIRAFFTAKMRAAMGDTAGARQDYLTALPLAEQQRDEFSALPEPYAILGLVYAGLGRKAEALAAVKKAIAGDHPGATAASTAGQAALTRKGISALTWVDLEIDPLVALIQVRARFGQMDDALALVQAATNAGRLRRNYLRLSPDWALLREDPRFRAIVEKAPL